jgi:hypothetical protein
VGNSNAVANAEAGPRGPGMDANVGNIPTQQGPEADQKMHPPAPQEPEAEEERPNPQDPPSANPYS